MDKRLFKNSEKRRFDRKQLYYYLKVNHHETDALAGYLGDISMEGLMLFSKESIDLNKGFKLRINLNKEFGLEDNFVVDVKSLWCEKDVNPEFFLIGFKYIKLEQPSADIVQYLIKKYGFTE